MTFIDSRTDSIIGSLNTGFCPVKSVLVPAHNRVYVGGGGNSFIPVIRTDQPGVEETPNAEVLATNANPTVVQGVLFLPEATSRKPQAVSLLDVSGRRVMDLRPGANDVRALAPGVYFLRGPKTEDGRLDAAVRKIVLTE
jgi:hypothetical protein